MVDPDLLAQAVLPPAAPAVRGRAVAARPIRRMPPMPDPTIPARVAAGLWADAADKRLQRARRQRTPPSRLVLLEQHVAVLRDLTYDRSARPLRGLPAVDAAACALLAVYVADLWPEALAELEARLEAIGHPAAGKIAAARGLDVDRIVRLVLGLAD